MCIHAVLEIQTENILNFLEKNSLKDDFGVVAINRTKRTFFFIHVPAKNVLVSDLERKLVKKLCYFIFGHLC